MTDPKRLSAITVTMMVAVFSWIPVALALVVDGFDTRIDLFPSLHHVPLGKVATGSCLLIGVFVLSWATRPIAKMNTTRMALQRLGLWLCFMAWLALSALGIWVPPRAEASGIALVALGLGAACLTRIWQIGRDIDALRKAADRGL